jgi:hypothetical protein
MEDATRRYVPKSVHLIDQVHEVLLFHRYAHSTEKSYVSWILQYIRFHDKKHCREMMRNLPFFLSGNYSDPAL